MSMFLMQLYLSIIRRQISFLLYHFSSPYLFISLPFPVHFAHYIELDIVAEVDD